MNLNFRSALWGFHREDVARYLEYLNNQHAAQLNQLNIELDNLRKKLANQEATQAVNQVDSASLARIQELENRNRELEARVSALTVQRDEALRQREEAHRAAQLQSAAPKADPTQELEAYRRAERTERMARERADQVHAQTEVTLDETAAQIEGAIRQVSSVSQQVSAQLDGLQAAIGSSRLALQSAADTIHRLKANQE